MSPEEFWSFNSSSKARRIIGEKASQMGVDPKALRVLFNTQWNLDEPEGSWIEFSEVPKQDLDYARSAGLMQDSPELGHCSAISQIIEARDKLDRRSVVSAFVSSLITRRMDIRSTLGSYAHALHLSNHQFTAGQGTEDCYECGFPTKDTIPVNHYTFRRIMWAGNVCQGDIGYVLCDLNAFSALETDWGKGERLLMRNIFSSIRQLPTAAGLSELEKSLAGLFPGNKHERQVVLEILGFCGILKPKDCPSRHEQWVRKCDLPEPTHFYRKEWKSPVSCWTGADGLNEEAVDFWFGDL